MNHGFAIALAWPDTMCKQAGAWYDDFLFYLGINKRGYYKVGHSAVVLIDDQTGKCRYFDFGRYHAPHGYGRVRCEVTDHDLKIETTAVFNSDRSVIININEILLELYYNPSTHGTGVIYGAVTRINFSLAISYAEELQKKDFIPYGPFISNGNNCSRFTNQVIRAGKSSFIQKLKLRYPPTITPSPLWNLVALGSKIIRIGLLNKTDKASNVKVEKSLLFT